MRPKNERELAELESTLASGPLDAEEEKYLIDLAALSEDRVRLADDHPPRSASSIRNRAHPSRRC